MSRADLSTGGYAPSAEFLELSYGAAGLGLDGSCLVWPGKAWSGRVRHGAVWAVDGSTELLRRLPAALLRAVAVGSGTAVRGISRLDMAWSGWSGQGQTRA